MLSLKPEIQFEVVQPRDARVNSIGFETAGEALVMAPELVRVGRIVVGHQDGILVYPNIALNAAKHRLSQMGRVPVSIRRTKVLTELMDHRLGHQRHRHLPVPDVEILGSRTLPTQGLVRIEELLYMPTFGEFITQHPYDVSVRRGHERLVRVVVRPFTEALHHLPEGPRLAAPRSVGTRQRRITRPVRGEGFVCERAELLRTHGHQQIQMRLALQMVQQFRGEVFGIRQDQRLRWLRIQDLGRQAQQFDAGRGDRAGGGGRGEAHRLMGVAVEHEKGRRSFDRPRMLVPAITPHLPFAVASDAMGIDGQYLSCEMTQGPPQLAQGHLQSLRLLDGSRGQQLMDGDIGRQPRQAVDQFEAVLTEGPFLAHAGRTQGGFVDQLQGQPRFGPRRLPAGPTAQQIPGAQPQMFGNQQPQPDQITGDLVGQQLPHAAFEAGRVRRFQLRAGRGALRLDGGERLRTLIEFFFGGRSLGSSAPRCGC